MWLGPEGFSSVLLIVWCIGTVGSNGCIGSGAGQWSRLTRGGETCRHSRHSRPSQMVHPNHRPTRSFFGRIKNRDAKASHVLAFKGGSERHKFSWGFRRRACQRRLARLLAAPRLICCLYVRHEPASHHSAAYSLSLFFLLLRFLDYWHHFPLRSPPRNTPAPHLAIRSFASQVAHVFRSRALMLAAAQHPLLFGFGLVPPLHRAVVGWNW